MLLRMGIGLGGTGDPATERLAWLVRRVGLPAPVPVTSLGALLLGSDPAPALTGRRCVPTRPLDEGFEFSVPRFEEAAARALASTGWSGQPFRRVAVGRPGLEPGTLGLKVPCS
ncbi:MAG: DUF1731 domain-containing protein, partial [Actinobacteria bacterium]|nr:DUF1731 domain-containing protein [Actinomycetota bacterium]